MKDQINFEATMEWGASKMTTKEIVASLHLNVGKQARITFDDGVLQSVEIACVDDEGFLHSGPDGGNPQAYWTRFQDVTLVEAPHTS